jgi:hypothetical protein
MNLAIMSTLLRLSTALAFVLAANLAVVPATQAAQAGQKPRLLVLTDIENGPDDAMSMVRFLVYANHYDHGTPRLTRYKRVIVKVVQ